MSIKLYGSVGVNATPGGEFQVSAPAAATIAAIIKAFASQSADLLQWLDSNGALLAKVRYDGLLGVPYLSNSADSGPYFQLTAGSISLADRGTASGPLLSAYPASGRAIGVFLTCQDYAGATALVVGAHASQTANLTEWRNSSSAVMAKVSPVGGITAVNFASTYVAVTATYTVLATDSIIDATSGTFTITLPTAVGISGREYRLKNTGAGTITVATTSSQTIDGVTTKSLATQYAFVVVVSDGANWKIVAQTSTAAAASTAPVALTDGITIATDASLSTTFTVTFAGSPRTMSNPTNATNGQKILYRIRQDATGGRTVVWDTKFRFGTDVPSPTLTVTAGKTDYIGFIYHSADDKFDCVAVAKGY